MRRTRRIGLSGGLMMMLAGMAGCGVVYTPQEFSESSFTYGYRGDFDAAIEVLPLTFFSARAANADGYVPRALPGAFAADAAQAGAVAGVPVDARLRAAGLDTPTPSSAYPLPSRPALLDGNRFVAEPGRLNDARPPRPTGTPLSPTPLVESAVGSGGARIAAPSGTGQDLAGLLETPPERREIRDRPLPSTRAQPYVIGVGDVIAISRDEIVSSAGEGGQQNVRNVQRVQRLLVQSTGEILLPGVGPVVVEDLTLPEARLVINTRLVTDEFGLDPNIEIVEFKSKTVTVAGLERAAALPITVRPPTLGEAIASTGGLGSDPRNTIVRVLRQGQIYEMSGERVLTARDNLAGRFLIAGDIVSITPAYDLDTALNFFDKQLRLKAIERESFQNTLAQRTDARAEAAERRSDLQLQIQLGNYRLEAEKLREQARLDQLLAAREADEANERARIANIEARQRYLADLRAIEIENRRALQQFESDTRAALIAIEAQRARERSERLDILRLQLDAEQREIDARRDSAQRERALFNDRIALGAVARDYVTVAGETTRQTTVPLPFDGRMTLARVLYEENNGIDRTTGDTSEIYVFRSPPQDALDQPLKAYHLDASNPAALAVASLFEMRPNDVVYVNPQPITNWNRVITQIIPSTGLLNTGLNAIGN